MKVYIVTSGSYSDYRIEEIFEKKKDAEALATVLSDGNEVEEWTVNKRRVVPLWSIWMKRNGDLDDDYGSPQAGTDGKEHICCYDDSANFKVLADSEERAIKVANERRAIILSHNLWGDNEGIKELFGDNILDSGFKRHGKIGTWFLAFLRYIIYRMLDFYRRLWQAFFIGAPALAGIAFLSKDYPLVFIILNILALICFVVALIGLYFD